MPGGFGHAIFAWIFGKACNKYSAKKLTRLMWAALLFGAIWPDIDFFLDWTIDGLDVHRTFTHSILGIIIPSIILYVCLQVYNNFTKEKVSKPQIVAFFFAIGILTHILLDMTTSSWGLQVMWPLDKEWITFNGPLEHQDGPPTYQRLKSNLHLMIIDVALGVAWMAYLYWKKNLSFD